MLLTPWPIMSKERKKKKEETHFKDRQISLRLFVYLHLWVTIYLPQDRDNMLFPFSSLSELQECPFTSFSVCLFLLLKYLKPDTVIRREERVGWHSGPGRSLSACRGAPGFPCSCPSVFPGAKDLPEWIRILFDFS